MFDCGLTGREAAFCHLSNHLQAAGEGKSGMLMGVHPVGFLEDWVFGDFQSLKPNPDEHRIQPIEASHLGTGRAGASLNLLAAWQAGKVTALGNLGASYNGNRAGDRTALWNASAAVLVTPLPALTLALDVGASRNPQHGTGATLRYGLLGAIWHVDDKTDLDLGWRRNLGGGQTASTWGVGLTLRW